MIYRFREKSHTQHVLECLDRRMELPRDKKSYLLALQKGFEGELLFDSWMEKTRCDCLVVNDVRIELDHTFFQIDSIIITSKKILFHEIKNFSGTYYYENTQLIKAPNYPIDNPLLQLEKCQKRLQRLLCLLHSPLPVEGHLAFVNPSFALYQAPLGKNILLPPEVEPHIERLNEMPSKISSQHRKLADQLIQRHVPYTSFEHIPPYTFDTLQKGIVCPKCTQMTMQRLKSAQSCICSVCSHQELVDTVLELAVEEVRLLFPNILLKTNLIYEWLDRIIDKQRIRKYFIDHYKQCGYGPNTYYVPF